ncbi:lysophospholipid acyltransferase [Paractinoplanes hotanensis]|uniref:Lysophospholipid acyltransferase n=1 Tax=Paractinoplanes hotanensis TaxID=2906497 RepID=A0ABT0YF02_9ACTN|nr:lysophospholipid acyltransferase [Actinoplanes hotanensis]MCM4084375.1 lysophospholipid acyltransferase [Actinoplanes hotanensis]
MIRSKAGRGLTRRVYRAGSADPQARPLPADPPEVAALLSGDAFAAALVDLADSLGHEPRQVRAEAAGYLREMGAKHTRRATRDWARFSHWLSRAHELVINPEDLRRLRSLDRKHALLFPFSHRSYLDGITVPAAISRNGVAAPFVLAGANLDVFPFNRLLRHSGFVYVRRSTTDNPVYRCALRWYVAQMIKDRRNLCWSIEGGRTRTGKLRHPAYGLLRYVVDALDMAAATDAVIVPVSIVYEQLHEVSLVTTEAHGAAKRPEDLRWLWSFGRAQREQFGRAYVQFGEALPLRERLAELRADAPAAPRAVERIAIETCRRINHATPVTTTAVVCTALLAADRAVTLEEVLQTVAPLARYLARRGHSVAGAADLTDPATIRHTLDGLVRSGVLAGFDGSTHRVWSVASGQHLVAAFYRNTTVHLLIDRAVGELSLVAAAEDGEDGLATAQRETLRLRDLLKFDFFFPPRAELAAAMAAELATVDPRLNGELRAFGPAEAWRWLRESDLLVAHLVLRPFLDAYLVVAEQLTAWHDFEPFDQSGFLNQCLRLGRQWALQKRLANEESVSLELFRPALRLAEHRGLLEPGHEAAQRRDDFRDQVRETVRRVHVIARLHPGERT